MEEDNKKNVIEKGQQIFDQFSDKMQEMDLNGLSDSIRESVDFIRKEAENGYRNLKMKPSKEQEKFSKYYETPYERYKAEQKRQQEMAHSQGQNVPHYIRKEQTSTHYIRNGQNVQAAQKPKAIQSLINLIPGRTSGPVEIGLAISALIIFGGITWIVGIMALITALAGGTAHAGALVLTVPLTLASGALLGHGIFSKNRAERLKKCVRQFPGRQYIMLKDLAEMTGETEDQVTKDMKYLVDRNVIPGLTMDERKTCLLMTDDARKQYEQAEQSRIAREAEEQRKKAEQEALDQKKNSGTKQERELIYFQEQIQAFQKDMDDEKSRIHSTVLQQHMDDVGKLLTQIKECVEDHPDMMDDTGHLISYYLPCMSKLLKTFEDLEAQPIQGDNIRKTEKEIEDSFDTIKAALTNMYDEMFREVSMDISSDIQVMKAMMAQDGWNDGFRMPDMSSGMDLEAELEQESKKK